MGTYCSLGTATYGQSGRAPSLMFSRRWGEGHVAVTHPHPPTASLRQSSTLLNIMERGPAPPCVRTLARISAWESPWDVYTHCRVGRDDRHFRPATVPACACLPHSIHKGPCLEGQHYNKNWICAGSVALVARLI